MTPRALALLREEHGSPPEWAVRRAAEALLCALLDGSIVVTRTEDGAAVTASALLEEARKLRR